MSENSGFYSSLDADSLTKKGVLQEGAYYVWSKETLKSLLKEHFDWFAVVYSVDDYGYWEDDNFVLIRNASEEKIAAQFGVTTTELQLVMDQCLTILKNARDQRVKPRLDDKILTCWNGLMITALTDAYRYLGNAIYLKQAIQCAEFIENNSYTVDGGLYHSHKNG